MGLFLIWHHIHLGFKLKLRGVATIPKAVHRLGQRPINRIDLRFEARHLDGHFGNKLVPPAWRCL